MKKAKKIIALLLALTMMLAMTSCAQKTEEQEHIHKIGVIVYDLKDEQVQAFREYMEGYLGENFSDVDFLYSAGVTTDVEEMEFLNNAIAAGVEGIIAFNSFDLEKEVSLCASHISWDISDREMRWSIRPDMIWLLISPKSRLRTIIFF